MTEQVIAAAIGSQQSTINRIRNGVMTPNYTVGKALVDMAEACPAPTQQGEERADAAWNRR